MPIVRRFPRRHYLRAVEDDDGGGGVPTGPFPADAVKYAPEEPLPVITADPVYPEVPTFNPSPPRPWGFMEGLVEYAMPALALYVLLDEDASFLVRAAAAYAGYDWLTKSPISPLQPGNGVDLPVGSFAGRIVRKLSGGQRVQSDCGCGEVSR